MPLPTEPRTIFLGGLFLLGLLAALYVAVADRAAGGAGDRIEAAAAAVGAADGSRRRAARPRCACWRSSCWWRRSPAMISGVAGPAASWAGKLPEAIPQIQQQLAFLARPISSFQWMMAQLQVSAAWASSVPQAPSEHSVQCHGGAVQRHRRGCGRPVHHAGGPVLPAGVGRDIHASLRRDPADASPRSVRRLRSRWISSGTSPPI